MEEAVPASPDHVLVYGNNYFKTPPNSFIWEISQGNTGWWSVQDKAGLPMQNVLYSVPKNSDLLGTTWGAVSRAIRETYL